MRRVYLSKEGYQVPWIHKPFLGQIVNMAAIVVYEILKLYLHVIFFNCH